MLGQDFLPTNNQRRRHLFRTGTERTLSGCTTHRSNGVHFYTIHALIYNRISNLSIQVCSTLSVVYVEERRTYRRILTGTRTL